MAESSFASGRPNRLPGLECSDTELKAYRDKVFNYESIYRCRHMERMARNLFYEMGKQWIELDSDVLLDSARGYVFKEKGFDEMPKPVTNLITASVEVELSSSSKRELIPNVLTTSMDPRIEAAAKVAKDVLQDRLRKLNWPEQRKLVNFIRIVTGTGTLKSWWDETWTETSLIGNPNAQICSDPSCGALVASPRIGEELFGNSEHLETAKDVPVEELEEGQIQKELTNCPRCKNPTPLQPLELDEELAQENDLYGRPLGMKVPKGNTNIEVVSPFDFFPENSGVGITPFSAKIWRQATVRSMDWLEERYPDMVDKVNPEDPSTLMRWHPILGEWSLLGRFESSLDSGIYDDHVRVFEVHAEKSGKFPEGRSIIIAGEEILTNGPLYRSVDTDEHGTLSVSLVKYGSARWKIRHGEFWGHSLVDDLVSPQNQFNGVSSQTIDARERMGSPGWLAEESMDLTGPAWTETGGAKVITYQASPLAPTSAPTPYGGTLIDQGVYQEQDRIKANMKEIAGPAEILLGEAPKNITTTSGLQLLGENAEKREGPRQESLIEMYEVIWKHQLDLIWTLRSDSDEYFNQGSEGMWERQEFDRNKILGQTKVIIEKQSYIDKSVFIKEAAREAQVDGLYDVTSQQSKKKLLELRGLPTDVNEDLNRQVDISKRQWTDFTDSNILPVIDTSIDDFRIHFQSLATMLLTEEGRQLEIKNGWRDTLKLIAGWEEELQRLEMADAQVKQAYGGKVGPEQGAEMYAQMMDVYTQQMESFQQVEVAGKAMAQEGMAMGQPPPMAMAPPQQPPPPVFLPSAKEDRIYQVWKTLIEQSGQSQSPTAPGDSINMTMPNEQMDGKDNFLKFRSVIDAYRLMAIAKEMGVMSGMPNPAAPGTPQGMPGVQQQPVQIGGGPTQPAPGQPPSPTVPGV